MHAASSLQFTMAHGPELGSFSSYGLQYSDTDVTPQCSHHLLILLWTN